MLSMVFGKLCEYDAGLERYGQKGHLPKKKFACATEILGSFMI